MLRTNSPRLKWCAISLLGITAMQWAEGLLWLDGPTPEGRLNHLLTVAVIPAALLAQAWGPLLGSAFERPVRERRIPFFLLLFAGLTMVVGARVLHQPAYTQITPHGHLNWWSPENPPVYSPWTYGLWAAVIGSPFLLWWRPFRESLLIVSWGWLCALLSFIISDNAASHWCFYVSFYALFTLLYAFSTKATTTEAIPSGAPQY